MNKALLTLALGLMPFIMTATDNAAQATKLTYAIDEIRTIGARPSITPQDRQDFSDAILNVERIMNETDDLVIEACLYAAITQINTPINFDSEIRFATAEEINNYGDQVQFTIDIMHHLHGSDVHEKVRLFMITGTTFAAYINVAREYFIESHKVLLANWQPGSYSKKNIPSAETVCSLASLIAVLDLSLETYVKYYFWLLDQKS